MADPIGFWDIEDNNKFDALSRAGTKEHSNELWYEIAIPFKEELTNDFKQTLQIKKKIKLQRKQADLAR